MVSSNLCWIDIAAHADTQAEIILSPPRVLPGVLCYSRPGVLTYGSCS